MLITHFFARPNSLRRAAAGPGVSKFRLKTALASALAVGLALISAGGAGASQLIVGTAAQFATGGTFTLGDKDWTYLSDNGNWTGIEEITLSENANQSLSQHSLSYSQLQGYSSPLTLVFSYSVKINGANGPQTFFDARTNQNYLNSLATTTKEVYDSYNNWLNSTNNLTPLQISVDNVNPLATILPSGLTELWVRDTIVLSGQGGSLNELSNTFSQVPEIDPNSFGSALTLVIGSLALLERRSRSLRQAILG